MTRGITAQELPENQDPSVQYTLNEQTGQITVWLQEQPEKPRRGRPRKVVEEVAEDAADAAEGTGEPGAQPE